ncbi:AcrR family transcriptional regulator [Amycolatopsis endophytica]|uniref:AcrR family transcriptional regulator n=1 Tax=Amycolatopsis endophytica TaxID=860233 RepID=A0A853BC83_9PSEU|nr:TetR/AcrR family transcriptional regulator [Amycolatopsis endophytica]NYI92362.1 AcrR family transcriptional regulator [Amycolatopsis endophytica]
MVRDRRLTDAALTLLAEGGYEAVTMEKAATVAGVGKATVYRRWASRADLVADALETVGFADPTVAEAAGELTSFRDDLVQTLIRVTGCLDPERHRLVVVAAMAATHHPELANSLAARLTAAVDRAVAAAVARARRRGETRFHAAADTMAAASVVALLNYLPASQNRPLASTDFEAIVDRVLLPLLTQA